MITKISKGIFTIIKMLFFAFMIYANIVIWSIILHQEDLVSVNDRMTAMTKEEIAKWEKVFGINKEKKEPSKEKEVQIKVSFESKELQPVGLRQK